MSVINRYIINPNIVLYRTNDLKVVQEVRYDEFCGMINFWKMFFVEKYNAQPGERAFIIGMPGYHYYASVFAALELGIVLILDWPHCYSKEDLDNYKVKMFGTIDYVVCTDPDYKTAKKEYQWDQERNRRHAKNIIGIEDFLEYSIIDGTRYNEISLRMGCTPNDVAVEYPSSGTTGYPKCITNSHHKIFTMSQRIGRMFKFKPEDTVLHLNNLNHGHGLCLHFLPGFMISNEHYTENPANFKRVIEFISEKKINRLLLYTAKLLTDFLNLTKQLDHPVYILTLYQITPEIIRLLKEKNVAEINSTFGDTAIGAGFLLKTVTPATTLEHYDVANYGPKVDDFWDFEIRDGILWAKGDTVNQPWATSNDKFDLIENNYYFRGRADRYKIDDDWIELNELESVVRQLFDNNANIVVDFEMQKIYIVVWKPNYIAEKQLNEYFSKQYKNAAVSYVLRDQDPAQFFNGRKIDNSKIRDYCRNRLKL